MCCRHEWLSNKLNSFFLCEHFQVRNKGENKFILFKQLTTIDVRINQWNRCTAEDESNKENRIFRVNFLPFFPILFGLHASDEFPNVTSVTSRCVISIICMCRRERSLPVVAVFKRQHQAAKICKHRIRRWKTLSLSSSKSTFRYKIYNIHKLNSCLYMKTVQWLKTVKSIDEKISWEF